MNQEPEEFKKTETIETRKVKRMIVRLNVDSLEFCQDTTYKIYQCLLKKGIVNKQGSKYRK